MNLFLDTSAVIKLYHKESGSDELLNELPAEALAEIILKRMAQYLVRYIN